MISILREYMFVYLERTCLSYNYFPPEFKSKGVTVIYIRQV